MLSERRADGGANERERAALEARADPKVELREQIAALAHRHRRYGVGMIHLELRQKVLVVNYKRAERLYQEAGLQVRRRKRKKVPVGERQPSCGRPRPMRCGRWTSCSTVPRKAGWSSA